jgi:hypothetical protein
MHEAYSTRRWVRNLVSIEHRKDNISLFKDRSYFKFVQLVTPLVCKMKLKSKDEGLLNGP